MQSRSLFDRQVAGVREGFARLARIVGVVARLLLEHANLLDVEAGELRPDTSVLVEGERIAEVSSGRIAVRDDVARFDCGGRVLMPGLIDAHVHCTITTMDLGAMARRPASLVANEARIVLEGMLRRGFTTVRDAAGADRGLAVAVERGLIRGPRLLFSGRALSQTGGHGDFRPLEESTSFCACDVFQSGISYVADGIDAVRRAARENFRRGATQLKIMASGGVASPSDPVWNVQYSAEEMRAAVEVAESWRSYAFAHAYTPEAIAQAVRAGVRSIEHGNLLDDATAALMASSSVFLVPTLVTYFKIHELGKSLGFPAGSQRKVHDVLDAGLASLEIAARAGVPIGFGTDLLGETHDYQSEEFVIRREVMEPIDIIRSATVVNARLLRMEGEIGVVAPGAYADLVVVDGNPVAHVGVLAREPDIVVRNGVVYS
jgi:imidazolonepropionase-like amidohydrolase